MYVFGMLEKVVLFGELLIFFFFSCLLKEFVLCLYVFFFEMKLKIFVYIEEVKIVLLLISFYLLRILLRLVFVFEMCNWVVVILELGDIEGSVKKFFDL